MKRKSKKRAEKFRDESYGFVVLIIGLGQSCSSLIGTLDIFTPRETYNPVNKAVTENLTSGILTSS